MGECILDWVIWVMSEIELENNCEVWKEYAELIWQNSDCFDQF
jgi:hypothetical protein